MNYAASAKCPHCGEKTKWGICKVEKSNGEICGSKGFPYEENGAYYCIGCKTVYKSRKCEHCGGTIPADSYKGGTGCFIATAAYGYEFSSEVVTLQSFRDEILISTVLGRLFIKIYYFLSPSVAKVIIHNENLKKLVKNYFINPIVKQIMTK